ncbi:spore maturation protein A [Cyclonatronum proteinivorum]|uniref:Spore maturation protein A n=1 Tax=Cyclonatronum proteinivorum TaxID=1457365 RepID=A0A345UPV8_9BACT|nr:nucleoside recognition domain-containing protein [Cyclonatronum proteinivorum]AXJ02510.1 spore maturation protein A [Cyclonatronum proteinivorum]
MLNYIWAGLIIFSLLFAVTSDLRDYVTDEFQNGAEIGVALVIPENTDLQRRASVQFRITEGPDASGEVYRAEWFPGEDKAELIIPVTESLPEHWRHVAEHQDARDLTQLRALVLTHEKEAGAAAATAVITLPEVHLVKMRSITQAAFDMAEFAVTLAIGLIGIMALWLGLMKIAEESGLIYKLVKVVNPVLGFLFPNVPKDHPALGAISLNLSANMLGLGNAATPLGIKAMEELQKLNPDKESATNAMCMFLTMNTASVQLVPPVTLIALLGVGVAELFYSILITTAISLVVGVTAASYYARKFPEPPAVQPDKAAPAPAPTQS